MIAIEEQSGESKTPPAVKPEALPKVGELSSLSGTACRLQEGLNRLMRGR